LGAHKKRDSSLLQTKHIANFGYAEHTSNCTASQKYSTSGANMQQWKKDKE